MKIYTKVVLRFNPVTESYERVSEESFDYEGPLAQCGGGGDYSPPTPPDPTKTAAAQAGQDRATAQTNAVLLNPNVNSPYGTISYDTNSYNVDPSQTQVNRPTQNITLSPDQQANLNSRSQITNYLNQAGIGLAQNMPNSQLLAPNSPQRPTSIDYSNVGAVPTMANYDSDRQKVSQSVYDQQYALMKPELDLQRQGLQNQLAQTGNPLGSESYNTQMDRYYRNTDASLQNLANSAVSQGYNVQNQMFNNANQTMQNTVNMDQLPYNTANQIRGDTISENQNLRNQQINELSSLLQGTQAITNPSSPGYSQNALQSPDLAGMINQQYQSQLSSYNNAYQQQQNSGNSMMSGLFSLGSSVAPLFF